MIALLAFALTASTAQAAVFSDQADYSCVRRTSAGQAGSPSRSEVLTLTLWSNGAYKFSSNKGQADDCEGKIVSTSDGLHDPFFSGTVNTDRDNCYAYGGAASLQSTDLGKGSQPDLRDNVQISLQMSFQTYTYDCRQTGFNKGWL